MTRKDGVFTPAIYHPDFWNRAVTVPIKDAVKRSCIVSQCSQPPWYSIENKKGWTGTKYLCQFHVTELHPDLQPENLKHGEA